MINFNKEEIKIIRNQKESTPYHFSWNRLNSLSHGTFYKNTIAYFELKTKEEKQELKKVLLELEKYLYDSKDILTNEDFNFEREENISNEDLEEILSREDWLEDKQISIIVPVIKNVDNIRKKFLFKSYINDINEIIIKNISEEDFPEVDSSPTEFCLNHLKQQQQQPIINYTEIFNSLKEKLKKHSYHTNTKVYDVLTTWIMSTYFRELFRKFGYIDIASPVWGYGKTTTLILIVSACYYGIYFENPTEAVLFRLIDKTKGVVGIDEFDKKLANYKNNSNLINYVLSSTTYGIKTPRVDMSTDPPELRFYDGFGGKVLTRLKYSDNQLLDRSITVSMEKADGRIEDIPEEFTVYEYFQEERDLCYLMRLFEHQRIKELIPVVKNELIKEKIFDRLADKYLQPLVIAKFLDDQKVFQNIIDYAKEQEKETKEEILDTDLSKLLLIIMKNKEWKNQWVLNNDITNAYNEYLVSIGELKKDSFDQIINPVGPFEVSENIKSLRFENKRTNKGRTFKITSKRITILFNIYLSNIKEDEYKEIFDIYPECRHDCNTRHITDYSDSDESGESDYTIGEYPINNNSPNNSFEDTSNVEKLKDIVFKLEREKKYAEISEILSQAKEQGLTKDFVETNLKRLVSDGELFYPGGKENHFKKV